MSFHQSAISISMPKAGSSICDMILVDFYSEKGYEIDRIAEKVKQSSLYEPEYFEAYQDKIKPEGVYYGVVRGKFITDMPVLKKMALVVQTRDPRDCLSSAYFSFSKSHPPPTDPEKLKAFVARQERIRNTPIDKYARDNAHDYRDRMRRLRMIVQANPAALVLKYEDMVQTTEDWLARVAEFTGQPLTPKLRATLGHKIDFSVAKEDPSRHKRQVTPGDHARKMTAETIDAINEILSDEMRFFGYSV